MFLHFIYWDELPDMEDIMGTDLKWASTLVAQHLLAAADRYALERLRTICESKLCEGISINTVATTLALAEQHHCFQLKAACLKFIALPQNLKGTYKSSLLFKPLWSNHHWNLKAPLLFVMSLAVMETDGFDYLKESCPCLLSELLEYVARLSEHSLTSTGQRKELYADGGDVNGRRVKQRLHWVTNSEEETDHVGGDTFGKQNCRRVEICCAFVICKRISDWWSVLCLARRMKCCFCIFFVLFCPKGYWLKPLLSMKSFVQLKWWIEDLSWILGSKVWKFIKFSFEVLTLYIGTNLNLQYVSTTRNKDLHGYINHCDLQSLTWSVM